MNTAKDEIRTCPNCNKQFTFDDYKANKIKEHATEHLIERDWNRSKFCSPHCGMQYSLKQYTLYQQKKRQKDVELLSKMNNPCCARCGFSQTVDIHHIETRKEGGDDSPSNLIVLCPNCHALFHRGLLTKQELIRLKKEGR